MPISIIFDTTKMDEAVNVCEKRGPSWEKRWLPHERCMHNGNDKCPCTDRKYALFQLLQHLVANASTRWHSLTVFWYHSQYYFDFDHSRYQGASISKLLEKATELRYLAVWQKANDFAHILPLELLPSVVELELGGFVWNSRLKHSPSVVSLSLKVPKDYASLEDSGGIHWLSLFPSLQNLTVISCEEATDWDSDNSEDEDSWEEVDPLINDPAFVVEHVTELTISGLPDPFRLHECVFPSLKKVNMIGGNDYALHFLRQMYLSTPPNKATHVSLRDLALFEPYIETRGAPFARSSWYDLVKHIKTFPELQILELDNALWARIENKLEPSVVSIHLRPFMTRYGDLVQLNRTGIDRLVVLLSEVFISSSEYDLKLIY